MMEIKPGARLRSTVCTTEAIVVRSPGGEIDIRCGGRAMVPQSEPAPTQVDPDPAFADGSLMGKRYADEEIGLEVLVTKPGAGSLGIGETILAVKEAKALPSSD